jgi:hypothetical protein
LDELLANFILRFGESARPLQQSGWAHSLSRRRPCLGVPEENGIPLQTSHVCGCESRKVNPGKETEKGKHRENNQHDAASLKEMQQ